MITENKDIQVFQFHDYFSLPSPEQENVPFYFGTDEEVYEALKKVESLPIKGVKEQIKIGNFYKGFSQDYLRWNFDEKEEVLYLIPSKKGPYMYDFTTQIHIPQFTWVSIEYCEVYKGIEFNFISEEKHRFTIIFKLENHVRFVNDKLRSHEIKDMSLKTLEDIYHLLHVDQYTWYEKSMIIHKMILGKNCNLQKCSKDRPEKVSRWIDKIEEIEWEPIEDFGSEPCNCTEFIIEDWVHENSVFLSKMVHYLLESKKTSFSAKAIMMFIAFHYFSNYTDYNRTKSCIRNYARDLYNGTENGLNELVKLGWLEANEYQNYDQEWLCEQYGYHVCIDEYFRFSTEFIRLVGWGPYGI